MVTLLQILVVAAIIQETWWLWNKIEEPVCESHITPPPKNERLAAAKLEAGRLSFEREVMRWHSWDGRIHTSPTGYTYTINTSDNTTE